MDVLKSSSQRLGDVYAQYRSQLKRAAHHIVGDAHLAEDLVHDACVRALEAGADEAVAVVQPLSYAHRVVRNLAIDQHRRHALEARLFDEEDSGAQVPAPAAHTPEAVAIEREALAQVSRALASLPERVRRAFELYRLEGRTQREIGVELGLSAATVNQLIREALDCCRSALRAP
jgi:RNA polymerase sigma-70 factor (ECF subfamily)